MKKNIFFIMARKFLYEQYMTRNIFILIAILFITAWAFTFYKYETGTLSHVLLIFASISLLISGLYSKKLS